MSNYTLTAEQQALAEENHNIIYKYANSNDIKETDFMRTDLPKCRFKMCRNQFDGNCTKPVEHQKCEYVSAVQNLELIMGTQKFCVLCQNVACKNSITLEAACEPVWNGMRIGG